MTDAPTATVVQQLLDRPGSAGAELLAWQNPDGSWRDVHSDDVNAYLREVSGAEITAKDFRTWTATVLMAVLLAEQPGTASASRRTTAVRAAYRTVSEQLGNTPAVCRQSYVDPRVVDRFEHGETIAAAVTEAAGAADDRERQRTLEAAVCRLLSA